MSEVNYLYKEGSTKAQEDEARDILGALDIAYPGHPWACRVYDGGFFIYNLDFPSNWGMNHKGTYASASLMKKDVIMKAGEWLERAGLARGYNRGDEVKRLEGIPEKFQPVQEKKPVDLEALANVGKQAIQEQAIKKPV